MNRLKITIVGAGYVGMSLGAMLARKNTVVIFDIDKKKVKDINNKISTVEDIEIQNFLSKENLSLSATTNKETAYNDANFVIVATPTNYDPKTNYFDTTSVDSVISDVLGVNQKACIIIKSTVPVGHTKSLQLKHDNEKILFSPEFLREGKALNDCLYPSRIIVGSKNGYAKKFASIMNDSSKKDNIDTLFMDSNEAEAVKLFANTYLAMRVSFFNELDSYALANGLVTRDIITGVCLDERIGEGYNNPSFGYGGYCLPKDTKQLLANYKQVPQTLIKAIIESNQARKNYIFEQILRQRPKNVGIYRLVMKHGSDNFRSSAVIEIIKMIENQNIEVLIYEPKLEKKLFLNSKVISNLETFKQNSDIIIANRRTENLADVSHKCFSRDLFNIN